MTTREEEKKLLNFCGNERNPDLVLYACIRVSWAFEDICLYEIVRLRERAAR